MCGVKQSAMQSYGGNVVRPSVCIGRIGYSAGSDLYALICDYANFELVADWFSHLCSK